MAEEKKFQNSCTRTLALEVQAREAAEGEKPDHTIEFSFSSETPCDRGWYTEILDHSAECIRIGERQQNMPLLFNHDRDALIGKVERIWLGEDRRLHCEARFAATARAAEYEQMVRDGILSNVSFMYRIYDFREDSKDVFRATDWEPFEVSLVTVPADATVGVGRALPHEESETVREAHNIEVTEMSENDKEELVRNERARFAEIDALCRQHQMDEDFLRHAVADGLTVDQVRAAILEAVSQRAAASAAAKPAVIADELTAKEKRSYSLLRAIRTCGDYRAAGLEKEVSDALQKRYNLNETQGIYIPSDLGSRAWVGTDNLVPTEHHAEEYASYLRERSVLVSLGVRTMSGLKGNVEIPTGTGGVKTYWGKDKTITPSEMAFGSVKMSMKQVGALTTIPRSLLLQTSPDAETLVREDFFAAMAEAVDTAALSGTAEDTESPTGLLNMEGITVHSLGTNGGLITWNDIVDLETDVRNALIRTGSFSYLANPVTMGYLKKLVDSTGRPLWQTSLIEGKPDRLNGYSVVDSTLVPSNLTKGTAAKKCSAFIFGAWNEMMIGEWAAIEVLANPFGDAYSSGGIQVRALQNLDITVRRKNAFSVIKDFDPTATAAAA